jgi:hypothetical protein
MKINLKDNIWIEGFDFEDAFRSRMYGASGISSSVTLLYQGKTDDIPEFLAKYLVKNWRTDGLYNNYKIESEYEEYLFKSATKSIQSACENDYCIIYKNKRI